MRRNDLRIIIIILLVGIIGLGWYRTRFQNEAADNRNLQRFETTTMDIFDTVTQITLYTEDETAFEEKSRILLADLKNYHALYDIYNDYPGLNNLKTVNDHAGIEPVVVDQKIIDLLNFSKEMYRTTEGQTNVAMGSVLSIWHRYRQEGLKNPAAAQLPPMAELSEAAQHTDINKVIIDEKNSTVFLEDPDMRLDVGAVAKGYAAEMAVRQAEAYGVDSLLLSLGGNVCALGSKPDGSPWVVGIQNPSLDAANNSIAQIKAVDTSLVTSGSYQRFYSVAGNNYNHIIDPETLKPATYFDSVSVITDHSGTADALSTALFCIPYEAGVDFAKQQNGVNVFWVFKDGTTAQTPGFDRLTR